MIMGTGGVVRIFLLTEFSSFDLGYILLFGESSDDFKLKQSEPKNKRRRRAAGRRSHTMREQSGGSSVPAFIFEEE